MTSRNHEKTRFLNAAGWSQASIAPLAGDASSRRYDRLSLGTKTAVLMDAPPHSGETTSSFTAIARYLTQIGLHPPEILAEDPDRGFLLLEDLGDGLFARLAEADPDRQVPLYTEALSVLRHLHGTVPPTFLPAYGVAEMTAALDVTAEFYAGDPACLPELTVPMRRALSQLDWSLTVTILRDFHGENLIWCAEATGLRRVGLLDFQDACQGHPVFDAAFLLQDARRDVPEAVSSALKDRCWSWFAASRTEFDTAFAVLSAQRTLRILGVFARLSLTYSKPQYVDLIPRVWSQLQTALTHPPLADLAEAVERCLPPPEANLLDDLKERAGTWPKP